MQKILILLGLILFAGFDMAYACDTNQIDILGDGTQCETAKFTITTTELEPDTEFKFYMSARGTFYVDWGDGTIDTITRDNTTQKLYTHTYASGGVKTIRFGGLATGYSTTTHIAAIRFGNYTSDATTPTLIESIDGCIGAIFPTLGTSNDKQPCFFGFVGRSNIKTIPENLFKGVYGRMYRYAFCYVFAYCKSLTSVPEKLFIDITGGAEHGVFEATFLNCVALKSIPKNLFANVRYVSGVLFARTFENCTNLSGYIPPSTFAGLIAHGSPTESGMWRNTFYNTKLVKSCPAGTVQYTTGYEGVDTTSNMKWNGYVSCVDENLVCEMGEYLPAHWYQCEKCPENNYCVGGTYPYSETITSGITQCASGLFAPNGMWEAAQCGRILHVGDGFVYLRATKKTSPALHLDLDHDGVADYFGNMTTLDVPMSRDTQRKLKVRMNGVVYSIYDDSVDLSLYE